MIFSSSGLYGVTAYVITKRRTEIGIRIALGASTAHIVRLTTARLVTLIGLGAVVGAVASVWASRYIASLLYGVHPRDPASLAGAVLVLTLTAMLAGWTPVRAAVRTDPVSSIRCN